MRDFAEAVRYCAAVASAPNLKGKWGIITHENPFGDRSVNIAEIGPVWEKHGLDVNNECHTCMLRQTEGAHVKTAEQLTPGEDADALVRPLEEALRYGLED